MAIDIWGDEKMGINEVVKIAQNQWINIPGIVAIGTSKKDGCDVILVITDKHDPLIKSSIPLKLYGYEVIFLESGSVTIQTN
jgi:hypothetical protein